MKMMVMKMTRRGREGVRRVGLGEEGGGVGDEDEAIMIYYYN